MRPWPSSARRWRSACPSGPFTWWPRPSLQRWAWGCSPSADPPGRPLPGHRRCGADLLVAIALLQQPVVFEDIQCSLIGRTRDFHVRRPAAELLISRDAIGENVLIDVGEIRLLCLGDRRSRG